MAYRISTSFIAVLCLLLTGCGGVQQAQSTCPQPRFTGQAPEGVYNLKNPLAADAANIAAGKRLFDKDAARVSCLRCHGANGDGNGPMSVLFDPPPRNFTCEATINGVPDGQLFWIVQNGSPNTSMPAFADLSDKQVWQVVLYVRELANGS